MPIQFPVRPLTINIGHFRQGESTGREVTRVQEVVSLHPNTLYNILLRVIEFSVKPQVDRSIILVAIQLLFFHNSGSLSQVPTSTQVIIKKLIIVLDASLFVAQALLFYLGQVGFGPFQVTFSSDQQVGMTLGIEPRISRT